jgi:hypothetical protein
MKAKIIITQTNTVLWLLRTSFPYAEVVLKILTPKGDPSTQHVHRDPLLCVAVGPPRLRRPQAWDVEDLAQSITKHRKGCPFLLWNLGIDKQIRELARAASTSWRHAIARVQGTHEQRPGHLGRIEARGIANWPGSSARWGKLDAKGWGVEHSVSSRPRRTLRAMPMSFDRA